MKNKQTNKKSTSHFEIILVIINAENGTILSKIALDEREKENDAIFLFFIYQAMSDEVIMYDKTIKMYLSFIFVNESNPEGKEIMSYSLTNITPESRRQEIASNNILFREYKKSLGIDYDEEIRINKAKAKIRPTYEFEGLDETDDYEKIPAKAKKSTASKKIKNIL